MVLPSKSLNPCFNGRYSQSEKEDSVNRDSLVLILVLMEDTLRVSKISLSKLKRGVLILVLMEDTLRVR